MAHIRDPKAVSPYTADEALARLIAGNDRFIEGEARFPTVQKDILAALAKEQHPYATVLGCSDSRVPPELIFDAGFGELFVIRVAGNVVSPEVMGTLQYAGVHLRTPLFVVLGHEGCGAVNAALATKILASEPDHISRLLDDILPGLRDLPLASNPQQQMRMAVEANVRWSMRQILDTPEAKARAVEGTMKLVGGIYELETGRVRFLM
jgi:carbonic anhydrase